MSGKIERMLRRLHISKRIFTVVTISIVVFTAVLLIVANSIVRSLMENQYFETDMKLQTQKAQSTELLITDVNLLSIRLMGDEGLYRIFRNRDMQYEQKLSFYRDSIKEIIDGSQVAEVVVVDTDGNIYSSSTAEGLDAVPNKDSFEKIDNSADHLGVYGMTFSKDGKGYVCLGRRYYFYSTSVSIGYIFVYIDESVLREVISVSESEVFSMLIVQDGLVLTCSEENKKGTYLFDTSILSDEGYAHYDMLYNGSSSIYTVRRVSELENSLNTPLYTVNIYQRSDLYSSINQLILIVVTAECLLMIFAIFICFKNANKIVRPIHKLQDNLESFGKDGELNPSYIESNDEFAELENTYNEMLNRIADLTRKNIDEKLEQRKLQLDALQAQINPHFLYNTLDTIVWIAKIKKQKEIEDLAMALAGFFRISLHKGDKFISVREELDFVKGFVLIQQTRFPNKFELVFDVPDELMDCRIFKIMIQPFVENSIKHGIAPKDGSGCITVRGYCENEDLVFEIIDDGVGIEQGSAASEQGELVGLQGYGIKNVDERIRLEYGDGYGVSIKSVSGEGTAVTIRVPFIPSRP